MKYVEFCAGIGGMRSGLDAAGWECLLAVDNDDDAIAVHRLAHHDALNADVTELGEADIPNAEAWVAGFPCQPFSSSGNRRGFGHKSGNVFEHITRLMNSCRPPIVILENVEGLLTNKGGHTFAKVLSILTEMNYVVDWLVLNLVWFGVPQTRPRVFMIAAQPGLLRDTPLPIPGDVLPGFQELQLSAFSNFVASHNICWKSRSEGALSSTEQKLRPKVGKPRPRPPYAFGPLGRATSDWFESSDISISLEKGDPLALSTIVAPSFRFPEKIRSIRYWTTESGRGPTKIYVRDAPTSHCIGTSIGGAPLFSVPLTAIRRKSDRAAFIEFANWHREQDGLLVMRLNPDRAVLLFGPHTTELHEAVHAWDAGNTRKYKLVGNMVAPVCAEYMAKLIDAQVRLAELSKCR